MARKKSNLLKNLLSTFRKTRGSLTLWLLVIIVIIGSIYMVGGVFPKEPRTEEGDVHPGEPIPIDFNGENSLQLQTIKFKECSQVAAVDFLVDNSGSMLGSKLNDLKNGLKIFGSNFPDQGILGLQVYSSPGSQGATGYRELVPISLYSDVKQSFNGSVDGMRANGFTYSRDAMEFAKSKLEVAIPKYPNKKFNLIFISDGIPETALSDSSCSGGSTGGYCSVESNGCRCYATEQDPLEVANQIKAMGVRIFTIAYTDKGDADLNNILQNLMKNVATTPEDYFLAPVSNQIEGLLAQISQRICSNPTP